MLHRNSALSVIIDNLFIYFLRFPVYPFLLCKYKVIASVSSFTFDNVVFNTILSLLQTASNIVVLNNNVLKAVL